MKVLLRIFIPLCIFSFIAFGISVAVLGTNPASGETAVMELVKSDTASTYEITDSFSRIKADTGASKLTIQPWSEPATQVTVAGADTNGVKVSVSGDTLVLRTEWSWSGDWFSRLLSGNAFETEVLVKVPDNTYKKLELHTGAGSLVSDGVKAETVSLDVGAGTLVYDQPDGFRTEYISADISAGSLTAKNAATAEYRIDVSAGSAYLDGLTGSGVMTVSAGSARAEFSELTSNCTVNVSAGTAILDIPENSSAKFICNKSAGDIRILAGGENRSAEDGDVISINGGGTEVDLSISAGSIRVVSSTASAVEEDASGKAETAVSVADSDDVLGRVGEAFGGVFSTAGENIDRAFSSLS